jgi:acyl-CoA reductase-like NAD-dependent aldehyde dehydrogenase
MALDPTDVNAIVERVVSRLSRELGGGAPAPTGYRPAEIKGDYRPAPAYLRGRRGLFDDLDAAVSAARSAFEELNFKLDLAVRDRMIEAMRAVHVKLTPDLSRLAVEETGLGRVEDKIQKNLAAAQKTPGREILRTIAFTGDDGLTLHERAPFGVIGSITPTTNPTETIINNAISMVAGGNTVVSTSTPAPREFAGRWWRR